MRSKIKALAIRNVPPEVERAREKGISINKAVVGMLQEHVGTRGKKKRHNDLDILAGTWTK